jgi:hypothetical protein
MYSEEKWMEARRKAATEKAIAIAKKGYEDVAIDSTANVILRVEDNFTFAYATIELSSSADMKRYAKVAFSTLCIDVYYQDANAIGKDKDYTLDDVVQSTKNFFRHISKELEKVN